MRAIDWLGAGVGWAAGVRATDWLGAGVGSGVRAIDWLGAGVGSGVRATDWLGAGVAGTAGGGESGAAGLEARGLRDSRIGPAGVRATVSGSAGTRRLVCRLTGARLLICCRLISARLLICRVAAVGQVAGRLVGDGVGFLLSGLVRVGRGRFLGCLVRALVVGHPGERPGARGRAAAAGASLGPGGNVHAERGELCRRLRGRVRSGAACGLRETRIGPDELDSPSEIRPRGIEMRPDSSGCRLSLRATLAMSGLFSCSLSASPGSYGFARSKPGGGHCGEASAELTFDAGLRATWAEAAAAGAAGGAAGVGCERAGGGGAAERASDGAAGA